MTSNRVSETENKIVKNFLREQHEESFAYNGRNDANDEDEGIFGGSSSGAAIGDEDDTLTEDIRKMARALAPQISELEDVLKDFTDTETADALEALANNANDISRSMMEDEDDDLDDELEQLALSEQALREELEFAAGMSMLGSPSPIRNSNSGNENNSAVNLPSPVDLNSRLEQEQPPSSRVDDSETDRPPSNALQDHADYLQLKTERTGLWYYIQMTSDLLPTAMPGSSLLSRAETEDLVKDYCLPIPFRKLKRVYGGLVFYDVWESKRRRAMHLTPSRSSTNTPAKTPSKSLFGGLLQTPAKSSNISSATTPAVTPAGFTLPVPATPATPATINKTAPNSTTQQKPPRTPLQPISSTNIYDNSNIEEPLPVRTISIRVRPDVLCGAIMDAAHHAFQMLPSDCTTNIIKRQGGHLRGAVYLPKQQLAYVIDVQLCTQKNLTLERRLLLRFYHIQDDPEALQELGQILQRRQQQAENHPQPAGNENKMENDENNDDLAQERSTANRHMKQACSLVQRLMAAEKQKGGIQKMDHKQQYSWLGLMNTGFDSKNDMQQAICKHLEKNYKSCPSVREENKKAAPTIRRLTLPSLSKRDWPMLDVSWTLTNYIIEELDTRDCSYNTLTTLPFGQFPSLPTLDVQYCSQLRRLSRENMLTYLLKSAKELERYANRAEYNCAVCITLLDPMMERYGVLALSLPTPKTLDEYPLEYTPPQTAFPPWGDLVMEALNKVAARTPTGEIDVSEAIRLVYQAFVKQDDEEQGARLDRKNAQIMDRLANMQSHQRALVQNIGDSHSSSEMAAESASEFLKGCEQALNKGKYGYPSTLEKDVPLIDIKMSLGASRSGRCYITAKQVLFVTNYIPLVGSSSSMAFDLNLINFEVDATATATFLNPFPNTVKVVLKTSKELVFSFRPAMTPARLQTFMTIIQGFARENKPTEYSQVANNDDEGILRLSETKSEEEQELSV